MVTQTDEEYKRRKAAANSECSRWSAQSSTYAMASLTSAAVLLWSLLSAMRGAADPAWIGVAVAALLTSGALMMRARKHTNRAMRLGSWYEAGLARLRGEKPQTVHTGEAFVSADHIYARDLDVIGANSLFGMLATTRTALGQRALAHKLLTPCSASQARARQAAVQELTSHYDLREQVALLGYSAFEELPAESFDQWLSGEATGFPAWLRPVLLLTNAAWITVLVAGLLLHTSVDALARNVLAVLAVQGALCLQYRRQVREELELASRLGGQTNILRDGLRLLRTSVFEEAALRALQQEAEGSEDALNKLKRVFELVEQRAKEWFYVLATLLSVGTYAAISLQRWKLEHAEPMRRWLGVWSEFDALLALSTYAAEHPANSYPDIVDNSSEVAMFVAQELRHPLLPYAEAVPNDIALDATSRFLLISGSNMAGKSTLLRAVGTNALLAMAGAPVPAKSLRMCALRIGASLAVGDSLADRKSKFLAEVERLRAVVALAAENPGSTLFLVDEIFSGTNSLDRKAAAKAVLSSLIAAGAIGSISTHDLTLAELAEEHELHGVNVHMASPDQENPLSFDYVLKPGVNRTTNALAIVRMLGLDREML